MLGVLSKVTRVSKLLTGLAQSFDCSALAKAICHAFVHCSETAEAPNALLKGLCTSLKTVFVTVEVTVMQAVQVGNDTNTAIQKQARALLSAL
jgi:hypothetical protein